MEEKERKEGIVKIDDREFHRITRHISARAKAVCETLNCIYWDVLPGFLRRVLYEADYEDHFFRFNKKFPFQPEWKVEPETYFGDIYLLTGPVERYSLCGNKWILPRSNWEKEALDSYWREKLEFLENAVENILERFLIMVFGRYVVEKLEPEETSMLLKKLSQVLLKQKTTQNETEGQKKNLEKEFSQLKSAVEKATKDLLNTKGICKSKKIAQIRENLERALERRSKLSKAEEDAIFDECHFY